MKKTFFPRTQLWVSLSITVLAALPLSVGIIGLIIGGDNTSPFLSMLIFGAIGLVFSMTVYCAIRSRRVEIEDTPDGSITINRGTTRLTPDGKEQLILQRTTLNFRDLLRVEREFHEGDGIITADTTFYCFICQDQTIYKTTFFEYGKKGEEEILAILKTNVKGSSLYE